MAYQGPPVTAPPNQGYHFSRDGHLSPPDCASPTEGFTNPLSSSTSSPSCGHYYHCDSPPPCYGVIVTNKDASVYDNCCVALVSLLCCCCLMDAFV
ncbi:hypothetical protein CLOM_g10939 [Closterium sp. NIES-68]|nr:hypothetical protein CLOM_g10939 [Closterium sp. NIES-68]GJP57805.1 hypothetical protein CLOP_g17396 [Closterium sp. NIES-67]